MENVTGVADKLGALLSLLTKLPAELEMIADEIDNENLRNALCAVAIESSEYAMQLNLQLKTLHIEKPPNDSKDYWRELEQLAPPDSIRAKGREISSICEKCEVFFTSLYTDVLRDYSPYKILRDTMTYQLFGIKCAFMKIRMLNSLRFT